MFEVAQETPQDWWEVEELYDLCFAPGREALSSYRLRDGVERAADLCLVARDGGAVQGAIRFWPVLAGEADALLLGPVAVHPVAQGEGLGGRLVLEGIDRARDRGWLRVIMVGDLDYYGRFGFFRLADVEMPPPTDPERVLGAALRPGAWDGIRGRVARRA